MSGYIILAFNVCVFSHLTSQWIFLKGENFLGCIWSCFYFRKCVLLYLKITCNTHLSQCNVLWKCCSAAVAVELLQCYFFGISKSWQLAAFMLINDVIAQSQKVTNDIEGEGVVSIVEMETFSKSSPERVPSECRHCRLTSDIFTKEFFTRRQPPYMSIHIATCSFVKNFVHSHLNGSVLFK